MQKEKVAIIGLGKVGAAIGFLLQQAGYDIVAVSARRQETLENHRNFLSGKPFLNAADAACLGELILITTQDDNIANACDEIVQKGALQKDAKVIHMSGAGGIELLASAQHAGASVASIHPIQSFADIQSAIVAIPGTVFGITCNHEFATWCNNFVLDLRGIPTMVTNEDKSVYHAASCMTSSYFSTLMYMVEEMYMSVGMTSAEARSAFLPLVKGTLKNIEEKGATAALSGPVARGDTSTIGKHLVSIREHIPALYGVYVQIGLNAVRVARERGVLTEVKLQEMNEIFSEGGK